MKKNPYLFFHGQIDPLVEFKIKNADLRNPNIIIEHRRYSDDVSWKPFIESFIVWFSLVSISVKSNSMPSNNSCAVSFFIVRMNK